MFITRDVTPVGTIQIGSTNLRPVDAMVTRIHVFAMLTILRPVRRESKRCRRVVLRRLCGSPPSSRVKKKSKNANFEFSKKSRVEFRGYVAVIVEV